MSSKGRGAESVESDFYATPKWATEAILKTMPDWLNRHSILDTSRERPVRILEPCAGKGAIVDVLRAWYPKAEIHAVELDRKRFEHLESVGNCDRVWCGDFAEWAGDGYPFYDLVITNPPFTIAMSIIERTLPLIHPNGGRAVHLLRQAILASDERAPFWKKHAAQQNILPRRPSFARSLKCGKPKKERCGWARIQELAAAVPDVCLGCGGKVSSTTSDSADYAWFAFGHDVEREWRILDLDRSAA
jgi:hypothetical protein